jgi:hypothetical protein
MRKKKTPTLSSRDKYLQKRFLVTEEEYKKQFVKQNGACICGSTPKTRALHVDHDHAIEAWKVVSQKFPDGWWAWPKGGASGSRLDFERKGRTKSEAIRAVKKVLKRISVRGLLCFPCNGGLGKFQDKPEKLTKAAKYLERYNDYISGTNNDHFGS